MYLVGNYSLDLPGVQGIVASVLRVSDVLRAAHESVNTSTSGINMFLYDETADHEYVSEYVAASDVIAEEIQHSSFQYGLRNYSLHCVPSREFVNSATTSTPLLLAVGCSLLFAICIVVLIIVFLFFDRRRHQQREATLLAANRYTTTALQLLAKAKELAERANKSKSEFLGNQTRQTLCSTDTYMDTAHPHHGEAYQGLASETVPSERCVLM